MIFLDANPLVGEKMDSYFSQEHLHRNKHRMHMQWKVTVNKRNWLMNFDLDTIWRMLLQHKIWLYIIKKYFMWMYKFTKIIGHIFSNF